MKNIRIDDEQYKKLEYLAKKDNRSLTKYLYNVLEQHVGGGYKVSAQIEENKVPDINTKKNFVVNNLESTVDIPRDIPRDKQILKEITSLQAEIDAADTFNQDPEYWEIINSKKLKITELWSEWHSITGK